MIKEIIDSGILMWVREVDCGSLTERTNEIIDLIHFYSAEDIQIAIHYVALAFISECNYTSHRS